MFSPASAKQNIKGYRATLQVKPCSFLKYAHKKIRNVDTLRRHVVRQDYFKTWAIVLRIQARAEHLIPITAITHIIVSNNYIFRLWTNQNKVRHLLP